MRSAQLQTWAAALGTPTARTPRNGRDLMGISGTDTNNSPGLSGPQPASGNGAGVVWVAAAIFGTLALMLAIGIIGACAAAKWRRRQDARIEASTPNIRMQGGDSKDDLEAAKRQKSAYVIESPDGTYGYGLRISSLPDLSQEFGDDALAHDKTDGDGTVKPPLLDAAGELSKTAAAAAKETPEHDHVVVTLTAAPAEHSDACTTAAAASDGGNRAQLDAPSDDAADGSAASAAAAAAAIMAAAAGAAAAAAAAAAQGSKQG